MGFKDFITSFGYRRQIAAQFERYDNLQPPKNPSLTYIQKLVGRILDAEESRFAIKELRMIGKPASPALIAALDDPRYMQLEDPNGEYLRDKPLDLVLGLLVPIEPERVIEIGERLMVSASSEIRKIAAIHLTHTGLETVAPLLRRLLSDEDVYVRSYAVMGLERSLKQGQLAEGLRKRAYALLLEQCTVQWRPAGNRCPGLLIQLDREQAGIDLADPSILAPDNPNLMDVLQACNRASLWLPAEPLRAIFEDVLPRVVGANPFPHQYVLGEVIELLAVCLDEAEARPMIDRAVATGHERIIECAANADAKIAGVDDAHAFVFDRIKAVGYEGLTPPQRVFYLATIFDGEVCNGGIMQFFGNSSGDYAVDTLEALKRLKHEAAVTALSEAMRAIGPLAKEADRDMRMEAFAGRFDELQEVFGPLEDAYYKTNSDLRAKMVLFTAEHAEDFR